MFKWYGKNLRFELEHGMKVLVFGDIDVYEQKGVYQLKVRAVKARWHRELYKSLRAIEE